MLERNPLLKHYTDTYKHYTILEYSTLQNLIALMLNMVELDFVYMV